MSEVAPDRREFWHWVWSAVRPFVGWVLAGLGALALFLGWYGVSGESLTSKQLPYLVSGGLTGIALIVVAGVFLATDDVRRQLSQVDELRRKVDDLYALLVEEIATPTASPIEVDNAPNAAILAMPAGTSYHRADCALVKGKVDAAAVDARMIRTRKLRPCRICEPSSVG